MNIIKVFTVIFFAAQFAFSYGLTGEWQGQGQFKINDQLQTEPCQLTLHIDHQIDSFCVLKSEFKCPGMTFRNKTQTVLKIQDGQLYLDGQVMGQISETEMISKYFFPDGREQSYHIQKSSTQKSENLFYSDHIEWTKTYLTEINGPLIKIN